MIYKNITSSTIFYILIIAALTFVAGLGWHVLSAWVLILIGISVLVFILLLINHFNRINRSLAYFFESIENEDSQLHFPLSVRNKSQRRLHESLNRVNKLISDIKINNECKEQYFQELIQHSATGLIALTENNKSELINSKASELLGLAHNVNFSLLQHRNPELWNLVCSIQSGDTLTHKIFLEGVYKHLSIRATQIKFRNSSIKLLSIQDIKQELETRELQSWQKLISILTHEIMNSVAPITSLSVTLRKFFKSNESSTIDNSLIDNTVRGLEIIEERGRALMDFVGSYRQLTKIPPPQLAEFSVYNWLNKIRILLHEELNDNSIQLDISVEKRADNLIADEQLLSQVAINIIRNAIDALKGKLGARKISIQVDITQSNQHQIVISNNGRAISPDEIEKVFIPFYTTKEGGSGIGLSLSQQIVQMHKGYIYAMSDEHSTRFVIII